MRKKREKDISEEKGIFDMIEKFDPYKIAKKEGKRKGEFEELFGW